MNFDKDKNEDDVMAHNSSNSDKTIKRRQLLKSLIGLPVLGVFAQQFITKQSFQKSKREELLAELELSDQVRPKRTQPTPLPKKDLIRIGVIGFGARGEDLARALGCAHPEWIKKSRERAERNKRDTRFQDWLQQEDLRVTLTGICDVFDNRAERGLTAAGTEVRPGGGDTAGYLRTKRYIDYRDMLADKDIDAVVIATPDHWHAQMTIDAVNAGKHVYCEKCMTRTEDEVYQVEAAVKKSGVVFQLGHQSHQNSAFEKAHQVINKNILGKITLIETTSNRNTPDGAWIRHLDRNGNLKPGNCQTIDWDRWLGASPKVAFSIDRYYNWTKWWDYGTGLSGQLLSHEYDTANQLLNLGIPASCVASGGIYFHKDNREIPDVFHAVFEIGKSGLTFIYSASLASSRARGRVFMGHDASMELGNTLDLKIDPNSSRFKDKIESGMFDPSESFFTFRPGMEKIDAITSATEHYYASRGLIFTYRDGRRVDTTYLHLKEWLDCIRDGGIPSVPIDKAVEVTLACHMATKSYREERRVIWDPVKKRIM
jgi:predicted dehydrogenase